MNKKKILSLILMLMIVVCCVTEALVIGELKTQNKEMSEKITELETDIFEQGVSISRVESQVADKADQVIPEFFLPADIYVCEGMTMEIYNESVCSKVNPSQYDFYWECELGDSMEDKYYIHPPVGTAGEYQLMLHIYDYSLLPVGEVSTTLHVVPDVFADENAGNIKLLTIGDSLSAGTRWISYTRTLSGDKIFHVGTLGDEEGLMNEGRPGITAGDYLNGTLYGLDNPSPFYNPASGEFDYAYYKQSTGIEADVIGVFLGTNGLELDPQGNGENIIKIVDRIIDADPNIQILLIEPIFPADQDGMARQQNIRGYEGFRGMWSLARSRMVFNLISYLDEQLADYDNVTIVPTAVIMDRFYGFDQTLLAKNPHSEDLDQMPAQGVHPGPAGYEQLGDGIYSALCYLIEEGKLTTTLEEVEGE